MIKVETRFRDRAAEVDHYFKLLSAMEDAMVVRGAAWRDGKKKLPKVLGEELSLKLMKATAFLLMYNLVEATVRDSIESIWRAVGNSNVKLLDILPSMREVWVGSEFKRKDAFSASADTYKAVALGILNNVSEGKIPSVEFKRVTGGGNIDHDVIRRMCQAHGVSFTPPKNTRNGIDLTTVKGRRNVLAHGEQTFEEIGSSHATSDLLEMKIRSFAYLRQYVRRVDRYIAKSDFKAA